jgi:hypothetical protein
MKDGDGNVIKKFTYDEWKQSKGPEAAEKLKQFQANKQAKIAAKRKAAGNPFKPHLKQSDQLKEVINQIIAELMPPASAIPTGDGENAVGTDTTPTGAADRAKAAAQARQAAMKAKAQSERDLKVLDTDKKWKEKDLLSLKKDKIPEKRKEIDALNKQAASGGQDTTSASLTENWLEDFKKKLKEAKRI